jgi:hypothetical protein
MDRPPLTIEAAGMLSRAKRRQDYCRVWVDMETNQWVAPAHPAPTADWSAGINVEQSGFIKFAAANGSVFPAYSYQALVYHLHNGLSVEQDIYALSFDWSSYGTIGVGVYEAESESTSPTWSLLGAYGYSTNSTPDSVVLPCSTGMRALRLISGYDSSKTLSSGDEWIKIANLRVYGQDGAASIGTALTDTLVGTGLASSYESVSVG